VSITMSVAGTPSASACRPDAYRLTCPAWWLLPVATLLAQAALLTKASRLHRRRPNAGPPNPWLAVNLLPATQCYVVTGDTCNETTFSGPFPDKAETEGRNSFIKCYISLTVHLSIILVNNQLFSMYLFISLCLHVSSSPVLVIRRIEMYHYVIWYTECHRRNGPNFGRVFLMLKYTDITQNTYIQS